MKNCILVIEDDTDISALICMNLTAAGYEAVPYFDGTSAWEAASQKGASFDLALLDLMLPGRDGLDLISPLTQAGIPVICLTARSDVVSKVRGLTLGAEDYMVKPFEVLELLVRIEKVLDRTGKRTSVLLCGSLRVDLERRRVYEDNREIKLKPTEFRLLTVFLQNRNFVLDRNRLLDLVWGEAFYGETRTVDVHVAKLRKKLKTCRQIITVPKGGYLFEDNCL